MNRSMITMLSILMTLALPMDAQTSGSDLISQVCEHVPRRGFCESALRSDPRSEGAGTAGLAAVALGLAASNATDAAAFIGRMLGGGERSLGPAVEQCLSECADQYADAVEQVEASIAAASAGDYGGLRPRVRAAIADAESCEEGFRMEAGGGDQMVMSRRNKVFTLLCDTALRIVELLVLA